MGIPADVVNAFASRLVVFPKGRDYFPPHGIVRYGVKFICRPMVGLLISYLCTDLYSFQSKRVLDSVEIAQVRVLLRLALEHTVRGDRYQQVND